MMDEIAGEVEGMLEEAVDNIEEAEEGTELEELMEEIEDKFDEETVDHHDEDDVEAIVDRLITERYGVELLEDFADIGDSEDELVDE